MSDKPHNKATQVGRLGRAPQNFMGAVNTPVFRATTMLFPTVADLESAVRGEYEGVGYGLHGLPTVTDLQDAIAELEGGHAALAVPSGLTATTLPLLALANPGDHMLVTDSVYGIMLAALLLAEIPDARTCFGGALLVGAAIAASRRAARSADA